MMVEAGEKKRREPEARPIAVEKKLTTPETSRSKENFSAVAVRHYARAYFELLFYSAEVTTDAFYFLDEVQRDLSRLSKSETAWLEEGRYTDDFAEATGIFLSELIDFVAENEPQTEMDDFLVKIKHGLFASSPNLLSALDFRRQFDFSAKLTRSKKLSVVLGLSVVGELAYNFGWHYSPEAKDDGVLQAYRESSLAEKLDKLNLTEILGAELVGAGSAYNHGEKKLVKLWQKIEAENHNAFIGYYLAVVKERMEREFSDPSIGPVSYDDVPSNARLWDSLTVEDEKRSVELENRLKPDRRLKSGEKFVRIAEDVVAIINRANLPVDYAKVDLSEDKETESKVSAAFILQIKDLFAQRKAGECEILLDRLIGLVNQKIFIPREKFDPTDSSRLASIWAKFGGLSEADWRNYFALSMLRDEANSTLEKAKEDLMSRAMEKNLQATRRLFDTYKYEIPSILSELNNPAMEKVYAEFIVAYESGDEEYAFHQADRLALGLKMATGYLTDLFAGAKANNFSDLVTETPSGFSRKIHLLAREFDNLSRRHDEAWEEYRADFEDYRREVAERFQQDAAGFNEEELLEKMAEEEENILADFAVELEVISEEEDKNKCSAKFVSFGELIAAEGDSAKGFGGEDGELWFRHLYRPAMKRKIESEFDFKLEALPFRYQVNFLRFLAQREIHEVESVKVFLSQGKSDDGRINRAKAFLSLESGELSGDDLVSIGEYLRDDPEVADKLFAVYASLAERTAITKEELKEMFKTRDEVSAEEVGRVSRVVLDKANALLLDFTRRARAGVEVDRSELLSELENYQADLILTAGVWKSVDKRGLSLADIRGVVFETDSVSQLTGEGKVMPLVTESEATETGRGKPFLSSGNIRNAVSRYAREATEAERQRAREILEMIEIYRQNYRDKPKLQQKIVEGFIAKLNTATPATQIYSYKKDGRVLAFNRFDEINDKRKYFGSFNVNPSLAGSAIGTELMRVSLETEAEKYEIEADCDPESPISSYYIEKAGFVVVRVLPNYAETGETIFNLERKPTNRDFYYRGLSRDEFLLEYERNFRENSYPAGAERIILKFKNDSNEMFESAKKLINEEGYKMTRYFFETNGQEVYCGFERGNN